MRTTAINDISTASSSILEEILNQPILTNIMIKRIYQRFEKLKSENEALAFKPEGETERLAEIEARLRIIQSELQSQSQSIILDKSSENITSGKEIIGDETLEMDEVLIKNIMQWIPFPSRLNHASVSKLFKKIIHEMLLNESGNNKFIIFNEIIIDPAKLIKNGNDLKKDTNNNELISFKRLRENKTIKEFFAQANERPEVYAREVIEDKEAEQPVVSLMFNHFAVSIAVIMIFPSLIALIASEIYINSDKFQNYTKPEKNNIAGLTVWGTMGVTISIGAFIFILRQIYFHIIRRMHARNYSRSMRFFADPNEDIQETTNFMEETKENLLQYDDLEKTVIEIEPELKSEEDNKSIDNEKWTLSTNVYSESSFLTIFPDSESSENENNIPLENYTLSTTTTISTMGYGSNSGSSP